MLTELSFRVAGRDNLVCTFTRMDPETRVVIIPLRTGAATPAEEAIYVVHAPPDQAQQLVDRHFGQEDGYQVIKQRETALTVRVPLRLPPVGPAGDPLAAAMEFLGPDAFYLPLVVRDGYIHCTLISPSSEGAKRFIALTKRVNKQLQPDTFQLLHVGPWSPTPDPPKEKELTARQRDVLHLAVAMDYYEQPRGATLDELAVLLDVSKAAVHKTLTAAENKVLKDSVGAI